MECTENNNREKYQFLELTFVLPGILVSAILGIIYFLALPIIELWGQKNPNLALSILLILLGLGALAFFVASPIYLLKKRSQWRKRSLELTLLAMLLANALPIAILAIGIKQELNQKTKNQKNTIPISEEKMKS